MPGFHKVAQGEHLTRIAAQYGFGDMQTIWKHPKNLSLTQKGRNPDVLFPGDILFIPEKQAKQEQRGTGRRHDFQLPASPIKLRLRILDFGEKPVANEECMLKVEGQSRVVATQGDGQIEQVISASVEEARLRMENLDVAVKIGHLDPVTERSGQLARLANLGYYRGKLEETDEKELLSAVEEFQCDHSLTVDGKCGPQTQAKLETVHGC